MQSAESLVNGFMFSDNILRKKKVGLACLPVICGIIHNSSVNVMGNITSFNNWILILSRL